MVGDGRYGCDANDASGGSIPIAHTLLNRENLSLYLFSCFDNDFPGASRRQCSLEPLEQPDAESLLDSDTKPTTADQIIAKS